MEVHQLNATLNWDSKHEANPWDLSFADVDVAMRCYPTPSLQVPFNFIQADGQRGYSVGVEYSYDILSAKRQFNADTNYSKFDTESFEHSYFDSANNPRFTHRDLDDVEGDEFSDDIYNVNSSFYQQQQRGFEFDDTDDANIDMFDSDNGQINFGNMWKSFVRFLDVKYVQGIFKAHIQKPFHTQIKPEDNNTSPNGSISHDSLFRGTKPLTAESDIESFLSPLFDIFPQVYSKPTKLTL
jgi:hypothetical protein